MSNYEFLDNCGTFRIDKPENTGYLYFPVAGENGIKSTITPNLSGQALEGQNYFVLQPVSAEDLHNNKSSRNFWCKVEGKGIWSATGASAKAQSEKFTESQEKSSVEAGIMWHTLRRESNKFGLSSEITSFVPINIEEVDSFEVMIVSITNTTKEEITFIPTAAVPIYGRSADNIRDHRHVTSLLHRIRTTQNGVSVKPTLSFDERGHQVNHTTYFVNGVDDKGTNPVSFYPVVEDYIGEGGTFENPEAVAKTLPGVKAGASFEGYEAIGGLLFEKCKLTAGQTKSYTILIGYTHEEAIDPEAVIKKFSTAEKTRTILEQTKAYWLEKCNVSIHTADTKMDNILYWISFQPMLRRIYGCSFLPHHDYGKGGRGWRDLWQDCLALLLMNPSGVRDMLLANYGGVRMDGTNATIIGAKQGEFIADRNNITRVWMDHGVWPLITTKLYIDQTGDLEFLLNKQVYFKDKQVVRGTQTDNLYSEADGTLQMDENKTVYQGTVLEHLLLQNLTEFYEVGDHNHMRLRGADWNDALDMAPQKGESVAFTAAYAGNLQTLADLIQTIVAKKGIEKITVFEEMSILFKDDTTMYNSIEQKTELLNTYAESCKHSISGKTVDLAAEDVVRGLQKKAEWIKNHIRETEWLQSDKITGGFFNGYYDNHGNQVEGVHKSEGTEDIRMMLTGQVFSIMSATATKEQVSQIAKAADTYLYDEKVGGYKLNTNFHELKTDMGRMFGFAYGHKENGAVFSHMTTMFANALYQRGFSKEGYKAIHTLLSQAADYSVSRIYPGIPEYFNDKGRGMYHYLTGAASWIILTVITEMFGVKGINGDLTFAPALMAEQFDENGEASISLTFGRRMWNVVYVNKDRIPASEYTVQRFVVDGKEISLIDGIAKLRKDEIEACAEKEVHQVKIYF